MSDDKKLKDQGKAVPARRMSRLAGLGGMAAGIAGGMMVGGVQKIASGQRPRMTDLMLTPSNARKVTAQLATMRGAAMKIGQMISMDSGDFLPPELADILARLRSDARHMPRAQLDKVLKEEWGYGWQARFASFDYRPVAAASIGQVHRAVLLSGDVLAIKVQYPGVRDSIDSDIKNVAGLMKMSGLIPNNLNVAPLIEEARQQLHDEADYAREAEHLMRFYHLLSDETDFKVPLHHPDFSTDKILAMSYCEGDAVEHMAEASQDIRNRITEKLITLTLRELFHFQLMQTDPNFANYRYDANQGQLVLLDFGASRDIDSDLVEGYRHIIGCLLSGDAAGVFDAAVTMGLMPTEISVENREEVLAIIDLAMAPLRDDGPFDFGANALAVDMRERIMDLAQDRALWHLPPAKTIFVQRKFGGIYLLATRLKAQVNVRALMQGFLAP